MPTSPVIATWTGFIQADNYEPPRDCFTVSAQVYAAHPDSGRPETVTLDVTGIPNGHRAVYLLDDGTTVRPHYVAGWHKTEPIVHLHPFPTNPDGRTRSDGRVIDYSTWALGPRRCYHVKIRSTS